MFSTRCDGLLPEVSSSCTIATRAGSYIKCSLLVQVMQSPMYCGSCADLKRVWERGKSTKKLIEEAPCPLHNVIIAHNAMLRLAFDVINILSVGSQPLLILVFDQLYLMTGTYFRWASCMERRYVESDSGPAVAGWVRHGCRRHRSRYGVIRVADK
jgi:hypothetical protein